MVKEFDPRLRGRPSPETLFLPPTLLFVVVVVVVIYSRWTHLRRGCASLSTSTNTHTDPPQREPQCEPAQTVPSSANEKQHAFDKNNTENRSFLEKVTTAVCHILHCVSPVR